MKNYSISEQMINLRFSLWAAQRTGHLCNTFCDLHCGTMAIPWPAKNISGLLFHKGIRHRKTAEKAVKYNQKLVCIPRPLGRHDQSAVIVAYAISLRPSVYIIIPTTFTRQ